MVGTARISGQEFETAGATILLFNIDEGRLKHTQLRPLAVITKAKINESGGAIDSCRCNEKTGYKEREKKLVEDSEFKHLD